jgi:hypothetical protein
MDARVKPGHDNAGSYDPPRKSMLADGGTTRRLE